MAQLAVGIFETRGIVTLLAGLEAMVKDAEVELTAMQAIGGGYMVVAIEGHIAAVRSAMEAAGAVGERYGDLRHLEVFPRPHRRSAEVLADPLADSEDEI